MSGRIESNKNDYYQGLGVNPPVASQQTGKGPPIAIMRVIKSDSAQTGPARRRDRGRRSGCQSVRLSRPLASDGCCSIGQRPRSHASPSSKQRPPCQCPITSSPHLLDAPSHSCPLPRGWLLASNGRAGQAGEQGDLPAPCLPDRSRNKELPAMGLPAGGLCPPASRIVALPRGWWSLAWTRSGTSSYMKSWFLLRGLPPPTRAIAESYQ